MTENWEKITDRLDRLLERAEQLLESKVSHRSGDPSIFDRYAAFRWEGGRGGDFIPVEHPHYVNLSDLVGIDFAKEELVRNTAQFVEGYPANNLLLWGERGTGKSSCVKGLLPLFADQGLRIVEVQRGDLSVLPAIVARIRNVSCRFILFCDDLSFSEGEVSYRELKALLDGGLEARPDNMLIYATSNRRHLMPERMEDNLGSEIHPEEAVSEKLSLADRFGLALSFYSFDQATYLKIVEHYAAQANIEIDGDVLRREALQWALCRGQRSGRAARQFVDDIAGRMGLRQVRVKRDAVERNRGK